MIIDILLNAIFTGIGVTIGTYLSNKILISKLEIYLSKAKSLNGAK